MINLKSIKKKYICVSYKEWIDEEWKEYCRGKKRKAKEGVGNESLEKLVVKAKVG